MSEKTSYRAPISNRLLAALPTKEYQRLFPDLEHCKLLTLGESIYNPGDIIRHVYFPNSGMISLLATIENSSTLEVGIVGNEGIIGLPVFLGVKTSKHRAIVQGTGTAMRMNASAFQTECKHGGLLPRLLQRFTHSLLMQVSQSAVCYRFHTTETRLARWLLMTSDRIRANEFQITQEFLSNMLGVRREAVNKAATSLQQQKLISYSRGNITIFNRVSLKSVACKCYTIIKDEEKSFPIKWD